jgi:hypothetical protein
MSSGQPCSVAVPVSVFPRPHLTEKAATRSRGTFLHLLPLTGLAAIATGQAGAACGHSQFLVMCAHCDKTIKSFLIAQTVLALPLRPLTLHTPATLVPVTGKIIWSENGLCPPVSHLTFSRFKWKDIPLLFHITTNWEAAFWDIGSVSTGEYKNTSSRLLCNQPGKVQ